jgi:WS/DGAT/MGAT family acyltransferase
MAAAMNSRQLDHAHPLWEMVLVEGLADGGVALLVKLHHALMDGMAGMQHMASLMSTTPNAKPPPPPEAGRPPRIPGPVELLVRSIPSIATRPLQLASFASHTVQDAIKHALHTGVETQHDVKAVHRCVLNTRISPDRSVAYVSMRLDDVKRVGEAFSATVNEVVLALVGGALREHLLAMGESVENPLIAGIPTSTHDQGGDDQSNAYAIMFGSLATHIADPLERLRDIRVASRREKKRDRLFWGHALAELTEIPSSLFFTLAARAYTTLGLVDHLEPFCNLVVSNVPGPPIPVYFAGARIQNLYPLGPIFDGVALNLTVVSVSGSLDIGLSACRRTLPDLWELASRLTDSLAELEALIPQSLQPKIETASPTGP